MKITKCSNSAIDSYRFCPFQYYLHYIMEIETSKGKSAAIGNIVHQTFEWMAALKKRNKTNVDPMWLFDKAWDMYPHKDLRRHTTRGESADYKKTRDIVNKIVDDENYNPYKLNVIQAEKWFEIDLPGEDFEVIDNGIKRQLKVRGFIDLIHELDKDTIEIVDWKSGKRDSPFDTTKMDFYGLSKKLQGGLYYLASILLYPQYKNRILTFYYIADGGPTTITLDETDIPIILSRLYGHFKTIKKDSLVRRNRSWKCKLCGYNKNDVCSKIWSDYNTFDEKFVKEKYHKISLENIK